MDTLYIGTTAAEGTQFLSVCLGLKVLSPATFQATPLLVTFYLFVLIYSRKCKHTGGLSPDNP